MAERINVTKTHLPELQEYQDMVAEIWKSGQLTNYGKYCLELESALKNRLGVKHLKLVSNGTIAIQLAIKALDLKGEIITTPFSYVATVSSMVWEGCIPVFVDIDENDFCIDVEKIEAAITSETTGILATHVYGKPCNVDRIKQIADKHNLKVIYDAAHAFDVELNGTSLLKHGDVSTLSFHATKVFHTGEGGAVITNDDDIAHKLAYMGNFGHNGKEDFYGVGVNAKISELHSAMGLCVLPHMENIIEARRNAVERYNAVLGKLNTLRIAEISPNVKHNYSYYPVVLKSEAVLLKIQSALNEHNIYPRRYFYPSLNKLPYVPYARMPVAESISERILCLPLSSDLSEDEINLITSVISNNL